MEIDFDADNQDDLVGTFKKLSAFMRERNIELSKAKELLFGWKIDDNGNSSFYEKFLREINYE